MDDRSMVRVRRKSRGRPKNQDKDRTIMDVALRARQRVFGLTEDQSRDPMAATVLGRLCLAGNINTDQHNAGKRFNEWHGQMLVAIKAPQGLSKGAGPSSDGDVISEDYEEWAIRAVARWEVAKDWLDQYGRGLFLEAERVCINDQKPFNMSALQIATAYLAKRMGLDKG